MSRVKGRDTILAKVCASSNMTTNRPNATILPLSKLRLLVFHTLDPAPTVVQYSSHMSVSYNYLIPQGSSFTVLSEIAFSWKDFLVARDYRHSRLVATAKYRVAGVFHMYVDKVVDARLDNGGVKLD